MVHGQCTDVGVGGYLLGGGVNLLGTTARHGTGSENVLEYTTVTADGLVARISRDNVTLSLPSRKHNAHLKNVREGKDMQCR